MKGTRYRHLLGQRQFRNFLLTDKSSVKCIGDNHSMQMYKNIQGGRGGGG